MLAGGFIHLSVSFFLMVDIVALFFFFLNP